MDLLDAAPLSVALAVAFAAVQLAMRALDGRKAKRAATSTPPDPCHDCRAAVADLAGAADRNEVTLRDIRDGVRDLVVLARDGRA